MKVVYESKPRYKVEALERTIERMQIGNRVDEDWITVGYFDQQEIAEAEARIAAKDYGDARVIDRNEEG